MPATFDQRRFQNLVLRSDRVAFKDMADTVLHGLIRPDPLREVCGLTVGTFDHFAQRPSFKKADLAKLLLAHLFITRAL